MADGQKNEKPTPDHLKSTCNFFVPKKKTVDLKRNDNKKTDKEGMADVFNQGGSKAKEKN